MSAKAGPWGRLLVTGNVVTRLSCMSVHCAVDQVVTHNPLFD